MSDFTIDISALKPLARGELAVHMEGAVSGAEFDAGARLTGSVKKEEKAYRFAGRLDGSVKVCCARCLVPVLLPYCEDIEFCFANCENSCDEYALLFEGNVADFEPVIAGTIKADIPISVLCTEDCKGLCEKCGCNLNEESCSCEKELINPVIDKSNFLI